MIQPAAELALNAHGRPANGNSAPAGSDVRTALSELPAGTEATLSGDQLPTEDRDMLRAMGLTDQAPVRVCRQGEPCIVQVRTTRVGLSRAIAELLHTVPLSSDRSDSERAAVNLKTAAELKTAADLKTALDAAALPAAR